MNPMILLLLTPAAIGIFIPGNACSPAQEHENRPETLQQQLFTEGTDALAQAARDQGDPHRGAVVFFRRRSNCTQCHAPEGDPSRLGPALASGERKNAYHHVVDSILQPSKVVAPEYRTTQVLTEDGVLHLGRVTRETGEALFLCHPSRPGKIIEIAKKKVEHRATSKISLMPTGLANQLQDRQQFLDLVAYCSEIAEQGPSRAKELLPPLAERRELALDPIDHVATIRSLKEGDRKAGRQLFVTHCASCHGIRGELAINPLARIFTRDEFKFGNDPYSLWKTISYGNGLMFRWDSVLTGKQRYQLVHFLREEILRQENPQQYFMPDETYFSGLTARAAVDAKADAANSQRVAVAPGMLDGTGGKKMIYGPFMQHGVAYAPIKDKNAAFIPDVTEKAILVDLPGGAVICYDAHRLSVSGLWKGKTAVTQKTHHTSYKGERCLTPGGDPYYRDIDQLGWTVDKPGAAARGHLRYLGLYLEENRVVLSYRVGNRGVLELPVASDDGNTVWRTFKIGPGKDNLYCRVASGLLNVRMDGMERWTRLVEQPDGSRWLEIRPTKEFVSVSVGLSRDRVPERNRAPETPDLERLTRGGARRWAQTVTTAIAPGKVVDGYAFDELTVPLANPWGSWMRTTALDFFTDGRMAVSTLSGDVWIVTPIPGNPQAVRWSRHATGLYEPLGLKVVGNQVYVRGRDRITRLHDLNGDGEADFYENFYEEPGEIGASYHAFLYELHTDRQGNFYFTQSGYKSPLTGAVVKLSPDGKNARFVGTDLRNPNGMGSGGPQDWITVADNPSGKAIYNGFSIAREGAAYGHNRARNLPMLVRLPARVDSSSGGQCWSHPTDWGPLSGSVIHASYSRCNAFYCLIQDTQPYPNGFAVQFPIPLKSGGMRSRVSPTDHQVYLLCHRGWDSSARFDGVIYRIRYTGQPVRGITGATVVPHGLQLTFGSPLDPGSVRAAAFTAVREEDQSKQKPTAVPLGDVRLMDARTVFIEIPGIEKEDLSQRTDSKGGVKVPPPISLTCRLRSADGVKLETTIHATVNSVPSR
ncbi:MAG: DUF6797 domain-containing protein [Planctomycetota bacterium]|nr:DUF6797 domain-containing protein [Planctomycetota bacterium]